ncbi:MAG: flippase-like domain-containing protein [Erysipelotrichaceae bacterium]|nr:flippase-like domain-containing protein [Erysipelotrichaceae bacterium]
MINKIKKLFQSYIFNIALIIFITLLVLYLTLKDSFSDVVKILSNANIYWVLSTIIISIFIQFVIGEGLFLLTKLSNPHYTRRDGAINAFVASFFHGITPSASGGQFAQVYIFKKQGVGLSDSASVLWMDFIIYQSTMIALVLFLIIIRFAYFKANFSDLFYLVIVGFLVNSAVIIGLWALVKFPRVYRFITTKGIKLAFKLKIIKNQNEALEKLNLQLNRFEKETKRLKEHKLLILKVVIVNLFRLLLYYSLPYFCAKALNLEVNFGLLIDIIALSSYVSMINAFIPIPGASGGTEATFMYLFSHIFGGVTTSGLMILWRFVTYYLIMLIGGVVFIIAKNLPDKITERE